MYHVARKEAYGDAWIVAENTWQQRNLYSKPANATIVRRVETEERRKLNLYGGTPRATSNREMFWSDCGYAWRVLGSR